MNEMILALAINDAIQIDHKRLTLDGKPIICVSMDMTCTFDDDDVSEVKLNAVQLIELFYQAIDSTVLPAGTELPENRKLTHDLPIQIERE